MFTSKLSRIINTGQSRSIILTGNVYDLFVRDDDCTPLLDFLSSKYNIPPTKNTNGLVVVTYALNDDIRLCGEAKAVESFQGNWSDFKGGLLTEICAKANGNPTFAMEIMRQMAICSRKYDWGCSLLFIVEGADMLIPEEQISRMSVADRRRVAVVHDWFSGPQFMNGRDSVVLIAESRSQVHSRVSKLPQVLDVEVPYPNKATRTKYLIQNDIEKALAIAVKTAGLSLHALRQLVKSKDFSDKNIFKKVEEYIVGQLGEGVVEFKIPDHSFEDVIGFTQIKEFLKKELIPAFKTNDKDEALSGAAIGGPIGGGKTFICEALAVELDLPVLVLKNIRSKWYGETDIVFERLRRALTALDKVVIFVDEADTVFGSIEGGHETERRLTGKIQAMMSDSQLRGKVLWLLMTARIHLLSPDIRRPGRVGDLIIPILDPVGGDYDAFLKWVFGDLEDWEARPDFPDFNGKSAAWFAAIRSQLKRSNCTTVEQAKAVAEDILESDIAKERRYQTLQALVNCTRKSLLPNKKDEKEKWHRELKSLER